MSFHLLAVLAPPFPAEDQLPGGLGSPQRPVELLHFRKLAAALCQVPEGDAAGIQVRGMRRDMLAHAAAVERLFEQTTVVPMRFGIILPDRDTVLAEVLEPEYSRLNSLMKKIENRVELTLRAAYLEEQVLREIAQEQPALARPVRRAARLTQDERLRQGQRIAAAIREKGEGDSQQLLNLLTPLAEDVSLEEPVGEDGFFNAAFLVERSRMEQFDDAVQQFYEANEHRVRLDYVGPLPPYSFCRIQLATASGG